MKTSEEVRVLMVAGGTGGHIFPSLAVAEELRRRGEQKNPEYKIEFVGTHRPLEAKLIPAAGFPLRTVNSAGLKGIGGMQRLRNLLVLPRTAIEVARILRDFRPHVVVGVGGYLAGPVLLEAAVMGIPTILIEPNARPGLANRLLAPVVRAAAVGFEQTAGVFGKKAQVTGHPVRRGFLEIPPRRRGPDGAHQGFLPVPGSPPAAAESLFTVLIVGGSLGSRAINSAVSQSVPWLPSPTGGAAPGLIPEIPSIAPSFGGPPNEGAGLNAGAAPGGIRIIHQTGEHDYNEMRKSYRERGVAAEVRAFIDDMPGALAQADLVISRAGATAVAELAAAGRASILIPFPGATDQHQLENARTMQKAGAALVIEQSELTPERLAGEIRGLLLNPATLEAMENSAKGLARPDAAARIADLVEHFVRKE